jgi:hypothetical protein
MTTDVQSAREDLAFLRALAEGSSRPSVTTGLFLLITGLIWAFDALVHWTLYVGFEPMTGTQRIIFDGLVTAVWLPLAFWLRWGGPKPGEAQGVGATGRAITAAAAGIGLSVLAMLAVFVLAATRLGMPEIFALYPSMVFIFFGATSLVGFFLVRRPAPLAIALGWFLAAAAMAAAPGIPTFIAIAGLAMLFLMALPGALILRAARKTAEKGS